MSPFRRHLLIAGLCLPLLCAGPAANAMLLDYTAFLGGTKVGEARVSIDVVDAGYEIKGKAKTSGLMGLFGKWKSLFRAVGIFTSGKPETRAYEVTEESGNSEKQIVYAGDQVHVTKNGKLRKPMPLPADIDLWSLLFLSSDCSATREVHDGKDLWSVEVRREERLANGERYCEFDLVDEDADRSVASVWLREIGDLTVPVQVRFEGALRGTFMLTDHALD